jgi:hypothetical protein
MVIRGEACPSTARRGSYDIDVLRLAAAPVVLGQVAPAGVPLAVSPAGAGLRRITLYQLSRLWANALAV